MEIDRKMTIVPFEKAKFKDDEVYFDEVTSSFYQNGDCTEDRDDYQKITVSTRNNGIARFINIKTEGNGWSISDANDLVQLIKKFEEISGICNNTKE